MNERFLQLTDIAYRLLEYFPDQDPLKLKTKEKVLSVMENLVLVDEERQGKILADIEIILGYFKIAKSHGWINSINYLIICNEYKKVKNEIKSDLVEPKIQKNQKVSEPVLDIMLSDRQKKILDFLKERESAQVMDLQGVLPTVTKRTIRRDLDELLDSGKIVRMGEFNQVFYRANVR